MFSERRGHRLHQHAVNAVVGSGPRVTSSRKSAAGKEPTSRNPKRWRRQVDCGWRGRKRRSMEEGIHGRDPSVLPSPLSSSFQCAGEDKGSGVVVWLWSRFRVGSRGMPRRPSNGDGWIGLSRPQQRALERGSDTLFPRGFCRYADGPRGGPYTPAELLTHFALQPASPP